MNIKMAVLSFDGLHAYLVIANLRVNFISSGLSLNMSVSHLVSNSAHSNFAAQ